MRTQNAGRESTESTSEKVLEYRLTFQQNDQKVEAKKEDGEAIWLYRSENWMCQEKHKSKLNAIGMAYLRSVKIQRLGQD